MPGFQPSSTPDPQAADWLTFTPTNGPVQRGGTLQKIYIEIHYPDQTRPLCQWTANCVSFVHHVSGHNLCLSTDKPLGFHIWGLYRAFTPNFIWLLRSCWFILLSNSQLNQHLMTENIALSLFLYIILVFQYLNSHCRTNVRAEKGFVTTYLSLSPFLL